VSYYFEMRKPSQRTPLHPWQIEDAARLRAIYDSRVMTSQQVFAETSGLGKTQGAISHFLQGRTALHLGAALKFARALRCSVADFSPTLSDQLGSASDNQVLQLHAKLSPEDQQLVLNMLQRMAGLLPKARVATRHEFSDRDHQEQQPALVRRRA